MGINAVIYARYSSHNQREESIEGQIRECRAYAERNGFIIVGEYIDRALSGKTDNRADFQRMIRDSEKGRFQAVIMYTLDRFARNRYDSAMYKARLKRNGVRVYYAKQYIPDEPEGIILESVLEGYAEYYSENLSRNIKRGMMENALACKVTGGPTPLGFVVGPDKKYAIDPAGAKIVREIYQMYADGHSMRQIVAWCNERGYRTAHSAPFTKNSLRTILTNDKYIGVYRYADVVQENGLPAIISKELFEQVQSKFKHNFKARARSKAKEDYLLTTKLFCGYCGAPMIGESGTAKNGNTYYYYKCATRKRNGSCNKHTEHKDWMEEFAVRIIVQQVLTDENIEYIASKAMAILEKEAADKSLVPQLEEELKDTNKRLKNLLSVIEQGIISDTVQERLHELEALKTDLEHHLAEEKTKTPMLSKERIQFWLESFRNGDIKNKEYRRKIIDTLLNSIYVYDLDGGGRRFVFTFNLSGQNTKTISVSDIGCFAPPKRANPNTWFFWETVFGFVFDLRDVR